MLKLGNTKSRETLRRPISRLVLLIADNEIEFQRRFDFLMREPLDVENVKKHRLS